MFKTVCAFICFLITLPVLYAQTDASQSAKVFYRDAAVTDVDAAARFLRENHPGAAMEMGDTAFRDTLKATTLLAEGRAKNVTSLEGYLAVLSGFDVAFGDRHVRAAPIASIAKPSWVGLIIGLRGDDWTVVDEDPWPNRQSLLGTKLLSCDGRPVEEVAQERLGGFRADWQIQAQRGLAAPWLLIDERNPFLKPIKSCRFRTGAGTVDVPIDWTPVARDQIIGRIIHASGAGAAGWGVRAVGKGWWISLQELTGNAPAVVAAATAHEAQLRSSPFIVLDLRGNRGGSSVYGDEIASILYSTELPPDGPSDCPEAWRVSPGNLVRLESYPALMGSRLTPDANAKIGRDIAAMRAAVAKGEAFSRPLHCPSSSSQPLVDATRAATAPKIFVLTDRVCFSSCLLVVRTFRELGAVQIGEATNADTWYQENRDIMLPSGLARFSTQTAVDPAASPKVGPYEPSIQYGGDLTDTRSVERWVLALVTQTAIPKRNR